MHGNLKLIPWPSAPSLPGQISITNNLPSKKWLCIFLVAAVALSVWWYLQHLEKEKEAPRAQP
jgi:hypothetical protein